MDSTNFVDISQRPVADDTYRFTVNGMQYTVEVSAEDTEITVMDARLNMIAFGVRSVIPEVLGYSYYKNDKLVETDRDVSMYDYPALEIAHWLIKTHPDL